LARFDGHPSSGVRPRKDVRPWRAWGGRSPGAAVRSRRSSRPRSWSCAAARHQARRDVEVQTSIYATRHRAYGIYDGHCHPFRLRGVKGWRRRPTARRRCDRPVGAGRSTALRPVLAPHHLGPAGGSFSRQERRQPIREPSQNPVRPTVLLHPPQRWRIVTDHPLSATPAVGVDRPLTTYSLPTRRGFQPKVRVLSANADQPVRGGFVNGVACGYWSVPRGVTRLVRHLFRGFGFVAATCATERPPAEWSLNA
jgi:hypothetical protein